MLAQIIQGVKGDRALVRGVSPKVHGAGNITIQISGRVTPQAMVSFGTPSAVNANGWCLLRNDGRYHRYRVNLDGGWTQAMGVEIDAVATGSR